MRTAFRSNVWAIRGSSLTLGLCGGRRVALSTVTAAVESAFKRDDVQRKRLQSRARVLREGKRAPQALYRRLDTVTHTAARVFGHRIGDGRRSGWKLLNQTPQLSERFTDFYARPFETYRLPDFVTERAAAKYWIRLRRTRRGKPPVKKGQGKRAKKASKAKK